MLKPVKDEVKIWIPEIPSSLKCCILGSILWKQAPDAVLTSVLYNLPSVAGAGERVPNVGQMWDTWQQRISCLLLIAQEEI